MLTLTQTVFDVADCNITQHYLGPGATDDPLAFSTAASYDALYQAITAKKTLYTDLRPQQGSIVNQLRGAYSPNKFWQRYLGSADEETYAAEAWEDLVPIAATWTVKLEVKPPDGSNVQVLPKPCILLFPFGWTTWINFQIDKPQSLAALADLVTWLMSGPAYRLSDAPDVALTLPQVFQRIGAGVRTDVYGGAVFNPQDILTVTTVLGKHGGSLSLGAMTDADANALKRIIRTQRAVPITTLAVPLPKGDSKLLDFVLHDGMAWFLWAEHRLRPFERNAQRLRCYHNNTVRSLMQTWILQTFLARAIRVKTWTAPLQDLVATALQSVIAPTYKNFSALSFVQREDFQNARTTVKARLSA